jgi:hypothetical protein
MKMHDIFCALFSDVRITRSLVLCACFVDPYLPFFVWPLCCLSFLNDHHSGLDVAVKSISKYFYVVV